MIVIHAWTFLQPLGFTHGPSIKQKPAACCCCPGSPRAARVSTTASSKSAAWSVVQTMALAAGSSISAALSWHGDIWPRFLSGSDSMHGQHCRRGLCLGTTVQHPRAGSPCCVYRCWASQSAPTVLKPSNPEGLKRESTVSQQQRSFVEMDLLGKGIGNITIY